MLLETWRSDTCPGLESSKKEPARWPYVLPLPFIMFMVKASEEAAVQAAKTINKLVLEKFIMMDAVDE